MAPETALSAKGSRTAPVRMCCGCRTRRAKSELLRFAVSAVGELEPNTDAATGGRGAYLCMSVRCLTAAMKRRAFERTLRAGRLRMDAGRLESFVRECEAARSLNSGEKVHGENHRL
ncbi:YlxR family protein [bacterium]|nr:YlxR family protein [bacterium]